MYKASSEWVYGPGGLPSDKYTSMLSAIVAILIRMRGSSPTDIANEILHDLVVNHNLRYRNNPDWAGTKDEPTSRSIEVIDNLMFLIPHDLTQPHINYHVVARSILDSLVYHYDLCPAFEAHPEGTGEPVEMIRLKQVTYFELSMDGDRSLDELTSLIYHTLGQELDWVALFEANSNSTFTFSVVPVDGLHNPIAYESEWFHAWLNGTHDDTDGKSIPKMVLNHMCHLGHIPAGEYIIHIGW